MTEWREINKYVFVNIKKKIFMALVWSRVWLWVLLRVHGCWSGPVTQHTFVPTLYLYLSLSIFVSFSVSLPLALFLPVPCKDQTRWFFWCWATKASPQIHKQTLNKWLTRLRLWTPTFILNRGCCSPSIHFIQFFNIQNMLLM